MKIVLQRVGSASVAVNGQNIAQIDKGYLALVGVFEGDTEAKAAKLADKIAKLRIFADENGKTNLSAADVGGQLLVVSQFTLCADCSKGNRPSFTGAGSAKQAEALYNYFADCCTDKFPKVERGIFGADMQVALINDGPFTLILEE